MTTIKVKLCDYDPNDPYSYGRFLLSHLERFYNVELSDEPDYVFFNEKTDEYLAYPHAIRIFYTGENVSPNFNICDYAISFDYLDFDDRHFRLPLYLATIFYDQQDFAAADDLTFEHIPPMSREELAEKNGFCSFVYSNYLADPGREKLLRAISAYKQVDSGGRYLNNVGGPVAHKLQFEKEHKFSIAYENSSRAGYTTEKLPAALAARTIPIYFGNPLIGREFNEGRFINAHSFPTHEALVARVREIDQNDDEYLRIVNQPVLADGYHFADVYAAFDTFLCNIFDQPRNVARRATINTMHKEALEKKERLFLNRARRWNRVRQLLVMLYKPLQRTRMGAWMKRRVTRYRLSGHS